MKVFAFYWLDGRMSLIRRETVKDAFSSLGYGGGAINAIDSYSSGKPSHYFCRDTREWIPFEVERNTFHLEPQMNHADIRDKYLQALKRHVGVKCVLPSKDEVLLERDVGRYSKVGEVVNLRLVFGEYVEGDYYDEESNGHHFLTCGTVYFHIDELEKAAHAAAQYVLGKLSDNAGVLGTASLEDIANRLDVGYSM